MDNNNDYNIRYGHVNDAKYYDNDSQDKGTKEDDNHVGDDSFNTEKRSHRLRAYKNDIHYDNEDEHIGTDYSNDHRLWYHVSCDNITPTATWYMPNVE